MSEWMQRIPPGVVLLAPLVVVWIVGSKVRLKEFLRARITRPARAGMDRLGNVILARFTAPMIPLAPCRSLAFQCVEKWSRAFPMTAGLRLGTLFVVASLVWHEGWIREGWSRPAPAGSPPSPLGSLGLKVKNFGEWGWGGLTGIPGTAERIWGHPTEVVGLLRTPIVAVLLVCAVPIFVRGTVAYLGGHPLGRRQESRRSHATSEVRYRPVVLLMLCALRCDRACKEHEDRTTAGRDRVGLERVSVRRVERVVRRAWITGSEGGRSPRRHQRRELKRHAGRVVAALRAAEARQDCDAPEALRSLKSMLVKISERYAEGRVRELLDEEDLANMEPVADHSWLHLVLSGAAVVAVLLLVVQISPPELLTGPVLALTITVVVTLVFRGRIPGPADLIDILRGADRR
ncbi:hypothetical protein [Streptomyces xanthophaeus]